MREIRRSFPVSIVYVADSVVLYRAVVKLLKQNNFQMNTTFSLDLNIFEVLKCFDYKPFHPFSKLRTQPLPKIVFAQMLVMSYSLLKIANVNNKGFEPYFVYKD